MAEKRTSGDRQKGEGTTQTASRLASGDPRHHAPTDVVRQDGCDSTEQGTPMRDPKPRVMTLVAAMAFVAALAALAGCGGSPQTAPAPSSSSAAAGPAFIVPAAPADGMPLGFTSTLDSTMIDVVSDGDGFLAAGWAKAGDTFTPRIWATTASGSWRAEDLPAESGALTGVARNGDVRVAVGIATGGSSLAFVQRGAGAWQPATIAGAADVNLLLRDVVSLADADGWTAGFAAGGVVRTETEDGTQVVTPVLYESADGTEWQRVDVPLPADVSWSQGFDVAVAGPKTAWPGVLVTAYGSVADQKLGARDVAFVLSSSDGGAWKVVSDDSFDQPGRYLQSYRVSANADRVIAGGLATEKGGDPSDPKTPLVAVMWSAGPDGEWSIISTSGGQSAGRSGSLSTIAPRPDQGILGAGFLIATEAFDVGGDYASAGGTSTSNPALQLLLTPNGVDFANVTSEIPGADSIAVIEGIAEGPDRIAMVGMQKDGTCGAWIVDPAIRY
jgi:hypothetical protein